MENKVLNDVVDIVFLLSKFYNAEDIKKFLITPNEILFKDTPLGVILSGEGHLLTEWLKERSNND